MTDVVPLTSFTHDDMSFLEGRKRPVADGVLALELERRGLVRIVALPLRGARVIGVAPGKVQAAGSDAPSSSSPAAHLSPLTTASSSAPGATRSRRPAR